MIWQLVVGALFLMHFVKAGDEHCVVDDFEELKWDHCNNENLCEQLLRFMESDEGVCKYGKVKNDKCKITPQCKEERAALMVNLANCVDELATAGITTLTEEEREDMVKFEIAKVRVYYSNSKLPQDRKEFIGSNRNDQINRLELLIPYRYHDIVNEYSTLFPQGFTFPLPDSPQIGEMIAKFMERACGSTFTAEQIEGVIEAFANSKTITDFGLKLLDGQLTGNLKQRLDAFKLMFKVDDKTDKKKLGQWWRNVLKRSDKPFQDLSPYCMNPTMSAHHDRTVMCNLKLFMNRLKAEQMTNHRIQGIQCHDMDCYGGMSVSHTSTSYSSTNDVTNFNQQSHQFIEHHVNLHQTY